jgi:hypothetical protein
MFVWDYKIKNFQPKNEAEWQWFLIRKINYGDFKGLKKNILLKYFPKIKNQIDPAKRKMLEIYFGF